MVRCSLLVAVLISFASLTLAQSSLHNKRHQAGNRIQKPVPPVTSESEKAEKSNNIQETPNSQTFPSQFPVVVNIYAGKQGEVKSESKQGQSNKELSSRPDWVAIFTGLLVLVTGGLGYLGWGQNQSTRTIERAYVKMSHSGWSLEPLREGEEVLVTMQVKNFGNTPATTTHYLLTYRLCPQCQQLPDEPDYSKGTVQSIEAFLVKGDFFTYSEAFSIPTEEMRSFAGPEPTAAFYLVGYVDYVDRFEIRHRAGYARRYDPVSEDLVFVTQPGYNYDRRRKKGEGNDWGKKHTPH